jgi:hypothetical protein
MNKENMENYNNDEMYFVIKSYKEFIKETLGTNKVAVSFFANSENFVDKIFPVKVPSLNYSNEIKVLIYQDFSLEKELLTDCNICHLGNKTFLKIITPFTRERTYDFIIAKFEEMEWILKELHIRQEKANFTSVNLPIIGLDFDYLKKHTIDFLLNEDFRKFCLEHRIPLKRGIILTGHPGTGKTLSLRWLKEQALKNKIEFHIFHSPKEFAEEKERYYSSDKKIFVFEDFDAMLLDRKKTGDTPNSVLSSILNILEGIDEIKDVVSIFTTNHINNFDSAFVRPGRIDTVIQYELPKEENIKQFFVIYLPEFDEVTRNFIYETVKEKNCDISYAVLKGICDDINIYKFNNAFELPSMIPSYDLEKRKSFFKTILTKIIVDKLTGTLKGEKPKDTKAYVL